MSKAGGWIPLDKGLIKTLSKIDRAYTPLEAMYSFTYDVDCGRSWTISGYAKLWNWSRNKVRKFLDEIRTQGGHIPDKKGPQSGRPIFFIDKRLWKEENGKRTQSLKKADTKPITTNNPNPNPNKKTFPIPLDREEPDKKSELEKAGADYYLTKKKRVLGGERLVGFIRFWKEFNHFHGKAEAADAWYDLNPSENILEDIIRGSRIEAQRRPEVVANGSKPKWAQGWLSSRRWEDCQEAIACEKKKQENKELTRVCGNCRQFGMKDKYGIRDCVNMDKEAPACSGFY